MNARGGDDRANRTAGDHASTLRRWLQHHAAGGVLGRHLMRNRGAKERHADQVLLRVFGPLADRLRYFASLADTNANMTLTIANNDERREGEATSALYYLRHAVDLHDLLCEGQLRRVNSRHLSALLELKPGSPGSICERLQAPMIFKSGAVKDNLCHPSGLRALSDKGSNFGSLLHLRALGVALYRGVEG